MPKTSPRKPDDVGINVTKLFSFPIKPGSYSNAIPLSEEQDRILKDNKERAGNLLVQLDKIIAGTKESSRLIETLKEARHRVAEIEKFAGEYNAFLRRQHLPIQLLIDLGAGGREGLYKTVANGLKSAAEFLHAPEVWITMVLNEFATREIPKINQKGVSIEFGSVSVPQTERADNVDLPIAAFEEAARQQLSKDKVRSSLDKLFSLPNALSNEQAEVLVGNHQKAGSIMGELARIEEVIVAYQSVPEILIETRRELNEICRLAEEYQSFSFRRKLPIRLRIGLDPEDANSGVDNFGRYFSKDFESAAEFLHFPDVWTTRILDEIAKVKIAEIIKMCDNIDRHKEINVFSPLVLSLLEKSELESNYPFLGESYDYERHQLLGYEHGQRDAVIRVVQRGFNYKGRIVSKSMVIVGR